MGIQWLTPYLLNQIVKQDLSDTKLLQNKLIELGACRLIFLCLLVGFLGLCYKVPQTWWLKITKIYFLTVLEARSLKPRFWQGSASSEGSRGESVPCLIELLVALSVAWLVAT